MSEQITAVRLDDALDYIIDFIKNPPRHQYPNYDYTFWLSVVVRYYLAEKLGISDNSVNDAQMDQLSPSFFDAAWYLCRIGVLRPSTIRLSGMNGLSNGTGFSLTESGEKWIKERENGLKFPMEKTRFNELILQYESHFGKGFSQRAIEANMCKLGGNYLATCVLAASATESIFLELAIAKEDGDTDKVLKLYRSANGTKKIKDLLVAHKSGSLRHEFDDLIKNMETWRNSAGHGEETDISENIAWLALERMLRFAQFAQHHWNEFIAS